MSNKSVGTSLQGHVDASYDDLVKTFGQPGSGDGYKVDAEWVIETSAGVATIYNYKDGKNYCGHSGLPVEKIRDWHIGGHSPTVVSIICERLSESAKIPELSVVGRTIRLLEASAEKLKIDPFALDNVMAEIDEFWGHETGRLVNFTDCPDCRHGELGCKTCNDTGTIRS